MYKRAHVNVNIPLVCFCVQVGDEVVISTTSYNTWETEKRLIAAVSADSRTLILDRALSHKHIGQFSICCVTTLNWSCDKGVWGWPLSLRVSSGETHSVSGTSMSYTLAADVGLLTRNIKIIGQEYPQMMEESFGARLLVGTYSWAGIDYKGFLFCFLANI